MPYQLFHDLFPEMAEDETRSITVFGESSETGLPPGQYMFCEMFCNDRGCDCRRVFFYVVASFRKDPVAVIAWGWEKPEFYAKWLHDDDPLMLQELTGPCLNLGSPQSEFAEDLLDLVREILLRDEAYIERVKRHYRLFRSRIGEKTPATPRKKTPPRNLKKKKKEKKKRKKRRR